MDHERETEILASFIHGLLALGHFIGFIHNIRRRNWKTAGFHLSAFTFDCWATFIHWKDSRRKA